MASFSERYGYTKARDVVQLESMDDALRNSLWNALTVHVWDHVYYGMSGVHVSKDSNKDLYKLCAALWLGFFKQPLDRLSTEWHEVHGVLRSWFFKAQWFEVYNFVEFVASHYGRYQFKGQFIASCNAVLQREVSAYRFVGDVIARITEEEQVAEVDRALASSKGPVTAHIRRALELLSNREEPDYRNSIKESMSAVESLVKITTGSDKGTLGQLLKKLDVHSALQGAFSNLYGYTSDEGGIRHALIDTEKPSFDDAKFFLVVCSAFVNLVQSKTKV